MLKLYTSTYLSTFIRLVSKQEGKNVKMMRVIVCRAAQILPIVSAKRSDEYKAALLNKFNDDDDDDDGTVTRSALEKLKMMLKLFRFFSNFSFCQRTNETV